MDPCLDLSQKYILLCPFYYYINYYVPFCQSLTLLKEYKHKRQISSAYLLWSLKSNPKYLKYEEEMGRAEPWCLTCAQRPCHKWCHSSLPWNSSKHSGPQGCCSSPAPSRFGNLSPFMNFIGKFPSLFEYPWIGAQCQIKPVASNSGSISFQCIANYRYTCMFFLFLPHFPFFPVLAPVFVHHFSPSVSVQQLSTWFSYRGQNVYPHGLSIKQLKTSSIPILNQSINPGSASWINNFLKPQLDAQNSNLCCGETHSCYSSQFAPTTHVHPVLKSISQTLLKYISEAPAFPECLKHPEKCQTFFLPTPPHRHFFTEMKSPAKSTWTKAANKLMCLSK